jgi:hypothetical protein
VTGAGRNTCGVWGYDQAFLESCRAELTSSPDEVVRRHLVVADLDGLVVGFYRIYVKAQPDHDSTVTTITGPSRT